MMPESKLSMSMFASRADLEIARKIEKADYLNRLASYLEESLSNFKRSSGTGPDKDLILFHLEQFMDAE